MEGRFIGINSSSLLRGAVLTIPHATVIKVVDTLLKHGHIRRGYLGVGTHPVRFSAALEKVAGQDSGLVLISVEEESPADKAGLLIGDILLAMDSRPITGLEDLLTSLGETEPGTSVILNLLRGGKRIERQITLGERV